MLSNFFKKRGQDLKMDIILHVFLLFSFLVLFLNFVIIPSSEKEFDHILRKSIDNIVKKNKDSIPKQKILNEKILPYLQTLYESNDPVKILNNNFMWTIAMFIIVFIFCILLIFFIPYFTNNDKNLLKIVSSNVFILSLVGIFEVLFFLYVLRSESHTSVEELEQYANKQFTKKYNNMLKDPENYKTVKTKNTIPLMVIIAILIIAVVFIPIVWFGYDKVRKAVSFLII